MKIGLLLGLVVVIHHASSLRLGCGCGPFLNHHHHHSCGCGLQFPIKPKCQGSDIHQSDDWCSKGPDGSGGKDCVPLVVRPHDLPKVVLSPEAAGQLTFPVAGPCAVKKAIVKPAVLPKPVCQHHGHAAGGCCGSCHGSCHSSCHSACHSSCHDSHISHTLHGFGLHGAIGGHGGHGGIVGPDGILGPGEVMGPSGSTGTFVSGMLSPADAVSVDLAYKMAKQNEITRLQSEDRLNFGFRKIPVELPAKKVVREDIPEEQIFNLNGQIVELKPINPCRPHTASSLAEEAAEELMQLQEEEAAEAAEEGGSVFGFAGPRRPTLAEIGFGAAKPPTPNLIDVPASAVNAAIGLPAADSCECGRETGRDISTNCGCGSFVGFHHHGGCGCHHACHTSCNCGCKEKCSCKIIPGNVEYKTFPQPQQICLPVPQPPDSCESAEIEISQEEGGHSVQCSCIPVCVKKCNHSCRKSCVQFEKMSC